MSTRRECRSQTGTSQWNPINGSYWECWPHGRRACWRWRSFFGDITLIKAATAVGAAVDEPHESRRSPDHHLPTSCERVTSDSGITAADQSWSHQRCTYGQYQPASRRQQAEQVPPAADVLSVCEACRTSRLVPWRACGPVRARISSRGLAQFEVNESALSPNS